MFRPPAGSGILCWILDAYTVGGGRKSEKCGEFILVPEKSVYSFSTVAVTTTNVMT